MAKESAVAPLRKEPPMAWTIYPALISVERKSLQSMIKSLSEHQIELPRVFPHRKTGFYRYVAKVDDVIDIEKRG